MGKPHLFHTHQVPCGRCPACRVNRAEDWANRMTWESDYHEETVFVTLTYDVLPLDLCIDKRVLQLFFKRLRKEFSDRKLKYFACGEYGEKYGRPHYHAVIFGLRTIDSDTISKVWGKGFVVVTPFNRSRARYVAGYLLKEVDVDIDLKGRTRPFALMSKKLGRSFCVDNSVSILSNGLTTGGKNVAIPRYFRKLLVLENDEISKIDRELFQAHSDRLENPSYSGIRDSIERSRKQSVYNFKGRESVKRKRDNEL